MDNSIVFGSVCSGIESATVAWAPLGWRPAWFAEIGPFACAVLKCHYPDITNLGDMRSIYDKREFGETDIDLLVGGTPCQSYSPLGLRAGINDPRGNLAIEFLRIADRKKPRWFVWENVPGVISSWSGPNPPDDLASGQEWVSTEESDFRRFLEIATEVGYCCAWRVLDAQYFGVPQRRERVFVVGYLGDWRPAAAALFEPEDLRGHPATHEKPEGKGGPAASGDAGSDRPPVGVDVYNCSVTGDLAATLSASCGGKNASGPKITDSRGIRILTPVECERLQGFADGYTDVPYPGRGIDNCRREALGNSMAVPVLRWLGSRIDRVDRLLRNAGSGGTDGATTAIVASRAPGLQDGIAHAPRQPGTDRQ